MPDDRQSKFVSKGFGGVTLVKSDGKGRRLLAGRLARVTEPGSTQATSKLNKQDLIGVVSQTTGFKRREASQAVEAVFDSIATALKNGHEVRVMGFGTFSVSKRKASTGRNPRTGEFVTIKASTQPKFKAGKGLRDAVN
jgi:DNA-binding protein HU-beta